MGSGDIMKNLNNMDNKELIELIQSLLDKVDGMENRIKVLEFTRSYVGEKIKNFYCHGFFGKYYDLKNAEVIFDNGLRIEVRTTLGNIRSAEFEDFEEKNSYLKDWLMDEVDDEI